MDSNPDYCAHSSSRANRSSISCLLTGDVQAADLEELDHTLEGDTLEEHEVASLEAAAAGEDHRLLDLGIIEGSLVAHPHEVHLPVAGELVPPIPFDGESASRAGDSGVPASVPGPH